MFKTLILSILLPIYSMAAPAITNVTMFANGLRNAPSSPSAFDIQATVSCALYSSPNYAILAFQDESGKAWASGSCPPSLAHIKAGDVIRLTGTIRRGKPEHTADPRFSRIQVLRHGRAIAPAPVSVSEITKGHLDWHYLQIEGLIRDVYQSETCQIFATMILADGSNLQRVNIPLIETKLADLTPLVGRRVRISGFPNLNANSYRSYVGREFHCPGISNIETTDSDNQDPFDVPPMESLLAQTTAQIACSGRVKARGLVICTWNGGNALVQTEQADVFNIHGSCGSLPKRGYYIEASGLPLSDNFHITLSHVNWRPCTPFPVKTAKTSTVRSFSKLTLTRTSDKARLHGRTVRFRSKVRNLPDSDLCKDTLLLEDSATIIPVNVSSLHEFPWHIEPGSEVEITGTYVMIAGFEHVGFPFSKASGFQIVLSDPRDLKVLRTPPWWTVERLLAVIGALLTIIVAVIIWNAALRHAATRKGRELFREQLGHVRADLKTEERTRLAVELHDTLAQNLTGVSMEIEAAHELRGNAPQPMLDHLGIAAKALKSCRDELRNCLWDLRSQALEEQDMTKAALKTLQPVVNDSRLAVRFNVPRAQLSDNTAHALLRVIRELVINAIRHGNAGSVKVAGTIDRGKLLCSVTDDGCGFDPEAAPGVLQGHFGLQGIQERIDELGGEFTLKSSPGKGTKATVSIPIPHGGGGTSEAKPVV